MDSTKATARVSAGREGFTLIEMLISVLLALIITGSSLQLASSTFRNTESNKLREEVYRAARFIGMSLERDIQTTGVGIESEIRFGTLSTFNDTLVVIHVPWTPTNAYPYEIFPGPGTNNPLPPGGTCGATCIDLNKDPDGNFDLAPGDIARLQVNAERRIILVTDVVDNGSTVELSFHADTALFHFEAAFANGIQLDSLQLPRAEAPANRLPRRE